MKVLSRVARTHTSRSGASMPSMTPRSLSWVCIPSSCLPPSPWSMPMRSSPEAEVAESSRPRVVAMFSRAPEATPASAGETMATPAWRPWASWPKTPFSTSGNRRPPALPPHTRCCDAQLPHRTQRCARHPRRHKVDWHYPDQPDGSVPADDIIYNADGSLSSPSMSGPPNMAPSFAARPAAVSRNLLTETEEYGACVEIDDLFGPLEFAFDATPTDLEPRRPEWRRYRPRGEPRPDPRSSPGRFHGRRRRPARLLPGSHPFTTTSGDVAQPTSSACPMHSPSRTAWTMKATCCFLKTG